MKGKDIVRSCIAKRYANYGMCIIYDCHIIYFNLTSMEWLMQLYYVLACLWHYNGKAIIQGSALNSHLTYNNIT
jgi:hypothetical protein